MTATFIIAKIMIYASAVPDGCLELHRCNIKGGHSLSIEHLFRIDGQRAFGRIYNISPVIRIEHEYEVIIRFLYPQWIMPHLSVGKRFYLESLCDIGTGTVIEIHDYGNLLTMWKPDDCPWNGSGVKRPDYYLTTELMGDCEMPVACFVCRKEVLSNYVIHEVQIDPTLSEEKARELRVSRGKLFIKMSKCDMIDRSVTVLPSFPDDKKPECVVSIANGRIYPNWDEWCRCNEEMT